jgi:hypothetical protein
MATQDIIVNGDGGLAVRKPSAAPIGRANEEEAAETTTPEPTAFFSFGRPACARLCVKTTSIAE